MNSHECSERIRPRPFSKIAWQGRFRSHLPDLCHNVRVLFFFMGAVGNIMACALSVVQQNPPCSTIRTVGEVIHVFSIARRTSAEKTIAHRYHYVVLLLYNQIMYLNHHSPQTVFISHIYRITASNSHRPIFARETNVASEVPPPGSQASAD